MAAERGSGKLRAAENSKQTSLKRYRNGSAVERSGIDTDGRASNLSIIEKANALSLPAFEAIHLSPSSPLLNFTPKSSSASYRITLQSPSSISSSDLDACFSLLEQTSAAAYRNASAGWRPTAKKREMRDKDMRFLTVRELIPDDSMKQSNSNGEDSTTSHATSPIVAFLSFLPTPEPPYVVLYIYELHLIPSVRRGGLGTHLMKVAEHVARSVGVAKTMLTVFTSNVEGEAFYRRLGYSEDEISPPEKRLRKGVIIMPEYRILSKLMNREPA